MSGPSSLRPALVLVLLLVATATFPPTSAAARTGPPGPDALATNISAAEETATGRFGDRVVSVHRGDVIGITIANAKNHRVVLGSDDTGFRASFRVTSGSTTVRLNTYKAGQGNYPDSEVIWAESGSIANVDLQHGSIGKPLEVGRYPMNVSYNGTESDVGAFLVTQRSTNHSSGWALPEGFEIDEETTAHAVASAGQNRSNNLSIASGDWLAIEVDASGLYGILEKEGLDGDDGISIEFVEQNPPPNRDPNTFEGDEAAHLVADPENGRFFLLVDTRRHDIEPGDVYDATFRVAPDSGLVGEDETTTTTFRVLERETEIFYRGRKLIANPSGKTKIAGNATMVAGTTFRVRVKNTGSHPFLEAKMVEVADDGSFEATFDFSSYPRGTNFTITIPETGLSVPGMVGKREVSTPTATPTTIPDRTVTPTISPTATATPELTYETNTPLAPQTVTESDGQPGFGAVGPVVGLVAIALFADRRRRWADE